MRNTCTWTFWIQGSYPGCVRSSYWEAGELWFPLLAAVHTAVLVPVVGSVVQTVQSSSPYHWIRPSWLWVWFVQIQCNFHVSSRFSDFQRRKINFLIIWNVRRSLVLRTESGLCRSEILYELMPMEGGVRVTASMWKLNWLL